MASSADPIPSEFLAELRAVLARFPYIGPLLGQVVQHGTRLLGTDTKFAKLISRHLIEPADFVPYRDRVLAERRKAWIGR